MKIRILFACTQMCLLWTSEQIHAPKTLLALSEECMLPYIDKLTEGTYKDDPKAKKVIKQLAAFLPNEFKCEQILKKLTETRLLSIKELYPNLGKKKYDPTVRWDKWMHLAYVWKSICVFEDTLGFDEPRKYHIFWQNKYRYTIHAPRAQFIEFASSESFIGWKMFDYEAMGQVQINILDLNKLKCDSVIKRFNIHSNVFSVYDNNFHITGEYGFLGSFYGHGALVDNSIKNKTINLDSVALQQACGFVMIRATDIQTSRFDLADYVNDNEKIYRHHKLYCYEDVQKHVLNEHREIVYEKEKNAQLLQFGLAEDSYKYAIVEIYRLDPENDTARFKNVFTLKEGYKWSATPIKEVFYTKNVITKISFVWYDTYITFASGDNIMLYSLQYKCFFKVPLFSRILPVFEYDESARKFREKKFELYLGNSAIGRYERYEFMGLKELDNCLQTKKLVKEKVKKLITKYANKPSVFISLLAPPKKKFENNNPWID